MWTRTEKVADPDKLRSAIRAIVREEIEAAEITRASMERVKERHEQTGGTIHTDKTSHVYVSGCVSDGGPENDRVVIGVMSRSPVGDVWSPTSMTISQVDQVMDALKRARDHIVQTRAKHAPPPSK